MRSCPEAANHSRYLAWDMQVKEIMMTRPFQMFRIQIMMIICTYSWFLVSGLRYGGKIYHGDDDDDDDRDDDKKEEGDNDNHLITI